MVVIFLEDNRKKGDFSEKLLHALGPALESNMNKCETYICPQILLFGEEGYFSTRMRKWLTPLSCFLHNCCCFSVKSSNGPGKPIKPKNCIVKRTTPRFPNTITANCIQAIRLEIYSLQKLRNAFSLSGLSHFPLREWATEEKNGFNIANSDEITRGFVIKCQKLDINCANTAGCM